MDTQEMIERIVESYDPDHRIIFLARLGETIMLALTESKIGMPVERCVFVQNHPKQGWRIKRVYDEHCDITGLESLECKLN